MKYNLKTLIEMPHVRPWTITEKMKRQKMRVIDVNNYSGDFKRIIVRNIRDSFARVPDSYFLSIEIQELKSEKK